MNIKRELKVSLSTKYNIPSGYVLSDYLKEFLKIINSHRINTCDGESNFFMNAYNLEKNNIEYVGDVYTEFISKSSDPMMIKLNSEYGLMSLTLYDLNSFTGLRHEKYPYFLALDINSRDFSRQYKMDKGKTYFQLLKNIFLETQGDFMLGCLDTISLSYYQKIVKGILENHLVAPIYNYLHPISILPESFLPAHYLNEMKSLVFEMESINNSHYYTRLWEDWTGGSHRNYKSIADKLNLHCFYDVQNE